MVPKWPNEYTQAKTEIHINAGSRKEDDVRVKEFDKAEKGGNVRIGTTY